MDGEPVEVDVPEGENSGKRAAGGTRRMATGATKGVNPGKRERVERDRGREGEGGTRRNEIGE